MKIQSLIVLSLVATVLAVPNFRSRRAANDTTTVAPVVDCGSDTPGGLNGLLIQLGNLLDGVLANVGALKIQGVLGGKGDLLNLSNLINQVRQLLASLLGGSGGSGQNDPNSDENLGLLSGLIGQLTTVIDSIAGNGTSRKYACRNSPGLIGGLLESLLGALAGGSGTNQGLVGSLLGQILGAISGLLGLLT